jgi:membrane protein
MDVFEQLVAAPPRSWWRQRVIAAFWVLGGVAALGALTWIVLFLDDAAVGARATNEVPSVVRRANALLAHGWQRIGALAVFFAMSTAALAAFYRTATVRLPGVRCRVWPGALVAMVSWAFVTWGFGAYVGTIAHYAVYYGGLAAIAIILLWLYLTSLALLVGAEVNAHLERTGETSSLRSPPCLAMATPPSARSHSLEPRCTSCRLCRLSTARWRA